MNKLLPKVLCWLVIEVLLVTSIAWAQETTTQPATQPDTAAQTQPAQPAQPGQRQTDDGWFAPAAPAVAKPALPDEVTSAIVIPIREMIQKKTFNAIRRKVIQARGQAVELIIFDMDTWGGEVGAALDIARLIKSELGDIYTVCYVRTRAVSAGALIALSCDEIIMSPVGKLGDSAPISMGGPLEGVEREKIETVLRTEFAESANLNGYSVALAESMVSYDLEVWLVRNKQTRQLKLTTPDDMAVTVSPTKGDEKILNPYSKWERVRVVVAEGKLLTLHPAQAVEYGLSAHIIAPPTTDPYAGVADHYNITIGPVVLTDTWSEQMVGFLTSPLVTSALFMGAIFFAYIEINTPGLGIPGGLAIACFAVLVGSRFLIGLANWWEVAMLAVGIGLIFTEVFVIPGFGVTGITGLMCVIIALMAMILPNAPDKLPLPVTDLDWQLLSKGVFALAVGFVASLVAILAVSSHLRKIPIANKLVLAGATAAAEAPAAETDPIQRIQIGQVGTVESTCRPVGKIRFGDILIDAISEGEMIEAGQQARVLRHDGNRLIIEKMS